MCCAINMKSTITASHAITIDLPIRQCQMLFTPAGEERWVDGWQPRYLHPAVMINAWKDRIDARLDELRCADIR